MEQEGKRLGERQVLTEVQDVSDSGPEFTLKLS